MLCWFDVPGSTALKRSQNGHRSMGEGSGGIWRRGGRGDGSRDAKRKNIIWNIKKSENEGKASGGKKIAALRRMTFNLRLHLKMNQILLLLIVVWGLIIYLLTSV